MILRIALNQPILLNSKIDQFESCLTAGDMDTVSEETTATERYAYARQILQAGIELTRYLRSKLPEHTRPSFWDQSHG